jgi:hypothetical protein
LQAAQKIFNPPLALTCSGKASVSRNVLAFPLGIR